MRNAFLLGYSIRGDQVPDAARAMSEVIFFSLSLRFVELE
jgi:hypothetical protein